jgi:hypothetical protein
MVLVIVVGLESLNLFEAFPKGSVNGLELFGVLPGQRHE